MNETEQTGERHFYDKEEREAAIRLRQVFGRQEDETLPGINGRSLELLYDHFLKEVKFPFRGEFRMRREEGEVIMDTEIDGLMDPDETPDLLLHGLVCLAKIFTDSGLEGARIPLAEIVINQEDPNYNLIEDYCIWFWQQISMQEI